MIYSTKIHRALSIYIYDLVLVVYLLDYVCALFAQFLCIMYHMFSHFHVLSHLMCYSYSTHILLFSLLLQRDMGSPAL